MSLEKSIRNLGKIYGLAERALPETLGDKARIIAASESPMDSLAEIMRLLLENKKLLPRLEADIQELLDDVDDDTPEHIDVQTQSRWWIGYYATRPTEYDKGITAMRKKAKMTQAEAAKALGTDQRVVSRWETGMANPSAEYLGKMAEVFGCRVDDLI